MVKRNSKQEEFNDKLSDCADENSLIFLKHLINVMNFYDFIVRHPLSGYYIENIGDDSPLMGVKSYC